MGKKIFMIDDDEPTLALVEKLLIKEGYEVMTKTTAIGSTLEIRKFKPDLVILDVLMPELSGDAIVEMIYKNVLPKPKIIFYSIKSQGDLFKLVDEKGADGYICKTDGPKALINKIKSLL